MAGGTNGKPQRLIISMSASYRTDGMFVPSLKQENSTEGLNGIGHSQMEIGDAKKYLESLSVFNFSLTQSDQEHMSNKIEVKTHKEFFPEKIPRYYP